MVHYLKKFQLDRKLWRPLRIHLFVETFFPAKKIHFWGQDQKLSRHIKIVRQRRLVGCGKLNLKLNGAEEL